MAARRLTLILFIAVLLGTGCGLPDAFYLSPPSVTFTSDIRSGTFSLLMTDHTSEPEFRGYELYYKLYADAATIGADANLGGSGGTVDGLRQEGFLTLTRGPGTFAQDVSVGSRTVPVLPIVTLDRTSSFPITISFNPGSGADSATNFSYASPTKGAVQQEIDRHVDGVINGVSRCKPFTFGRSFYLVTDPDFTAISGAVSGQLYLALYVASYGLQNLSTPIYSYPVYLGYVSLSPFS